MKKSEGRFFIQHGGPILMYGFVLLLACILYYQAVHKVISQPIIEKKRPEQTINLSMKAKAIASWHLFGTNIQHKGQNQLSDFKLIGIIYKRNGLSSAIISINNKETTFKEGEKLNNEITVKKIEPTKILLDTAQGKLYLELFVQD